jgi:hypothetical protein
MDLTSIVLAGAVAVILLAAIVIAALRKWNESDGYEKAFFVIVGLVLAALVVYFYWEVFLLLGMIAILLGLLYVAFRKENRTY